MSNKVEIFKSPENQIELNVQFDDETVWLNRQQLSSLFDRDIKTIGKHINNIFEEDELDKSSTVAKFATVQKGGNRLIERNVEYYNLDMIISVGYRINSKRGTQFRQWATQRLKDYLVQGYAINEKRLQQKQQEVEYLKTGIRILSRAIEEKLEETDSEMLQLFANGLLLLDDYDHELLDKKGLTEKEAEYPEYNDYMTLIKEI
jgi:Virulence protein